MNDQRLDGLRADSVAGYLKAIGVLRLVSEQADASARGSWNGVTFVLRTSLDAAGLCHFFLERYAPTPIFNPWNSGSGFDAKSERVAAGKTLAAVAATTAERWSLSREVLARARAIVDAIRTEVPSRDEKYRILRELRATYPDAGLPWLDAAVVVGRPELDFPRLLGTGGNDGRLDFSVNFLQRALDVIGPKPIADADRLLDDALKGGSSGAAIADVAIGQYSPVSAGGVNAANGYDAVSLVNPWDVVLLLEGAVAFAGSMVRRFGAGARRASFPFTFASVGGGFGSASSQEETRGEIWLPRWLGAASYSAVQNMLRQGRVQVEPSGNAPIRSVRSATSAIEAAQAVLTRSTSSGIAGFERIVVAQRNGLAFAATRVGFLDASTAGPLAADLAREATAWTSRVRRLVENAGAALRLALRAYDDAVFAYTEQATVSRLQQWLAALGALDIAAGMTAPDGIEPFRFHDAAAAARLAAGVDDGSMAHALAAGWASMGCTDGAASMRVEMGAIERDAGSLRYRRQVDRRGLVEKISDACARRYQEARETEQRAVIEGALASAVPLDAVERFLAADPDDCLFDDTRDLLLGYCLLPPVHVRGRRVPNAELPAPWCALKMLFDGLRSQGGPSFALSATVPSLLHSRRTDTALGVAQRDLLVAASALDPSWRPRTIRHAALSDARRGCAALLLPLDAEGRDYVRSRVLQAAAL